MGFSVNLTVNDFIKRGPAKMMKALLDNTDDVAEFAMQEICKEIINKAQEYVRDGRGDAWDSLWYVGPGEGESTPKFNNDSRVSNRNSMQPLMDTGELLDSFYFEVNGSEGVVGNFREGAETQEFGMDPNPLPGEHEPIPARPFLRPAIMDIQYDRFVQREIKNRIAEYMEDMMGG